MVSRFKILPLVSFGSLLMYSYMVFDQIVIEHHIIEGIGWGALCLLHIAIALVFMIVFIVLNLKRAKSKYLIVNACSCLVLLFVHLAGGYAFFLILINAIVVLFFCIKEYKIENN
jgi:hypothetical protein